MRAGYVIARVRDVAHILRRGGWLECKSHRGSETIRAREATHTVSARRRLTLETLTRSSRAAYISRDCRKTLDKCANAKELVIRDAIEKTREQTVERPITPIPKKKSRITNHPDLA